MKEQELTATRGERGASGMAKWPKSRLLRHLLPLGAVLAVLGPGTALAAQPAPDQPPATGGIAPDPYPHVVRPAAKPAPAEHPSTPAPAPRPTVVREPAPVVESAPSPTVTVVNTVQVPQSARPAVPVRHVATPKRHRAAAKPKPKPAPKPRTHHEAAIHIPDVMPQIVDLSGRPILDAHGNGNAALYAGLVLLLCALAAAAGGGVAVTATREELW